MPLVNTTPNGIDRNAKSLNRVRRNFQRLAAGAANPTIKVASPITNTAGTLGLSLAVAGGLFNNSGLSVKLSDTSLALAAGGLSANLATNSGLQVSSGLLLKLADNSLALAAGGVSVKLDAAGTITTGANGLIVGVDGTTIRVVANKLTAAVAGISPLTTKGDLFTFSTLNTRLPVGGNGQFLVAASGQTTGLQWIAGNSDTSLAGSATGLAVALATNSGLTVSSGVGINLAAVSGLAISSGLKAAVDGTTLTINGSNLLAALTGAGSPLTTKGDLYSFSTVNTRLPVGGNGQFLVAASGQTTGLQWIAGNSDTSLAGSATGLAVALATNSGLTVSSGVLLKLTDTSMALGVGGVGVSLATNSGLTISSGIKLLLADTSLSLAVGGVNVQLATNGGLELNTGLQVRGFKSSVPGSPADGDAWYDATNKWPAFREAGQTVTFGGRAYVTTADSSSVVSTTAETDVESGLTFPANFFTVGRTIRITAIGTFGTKAAPTGSFNPRLVLKDSSAVRNTLAAPGWSPAASSSGARWRNEMTLTCRSVGVAGTLSRIGFLSQEDQSLALAAGSIFIAAGGTTVTLDTTKTQTVVVSIQWGTSDANNTAKLHALLVEVL